MGRGADLGDRTYFFEIVPDLLLILGFDGYVRDANTAWSHAMGWSRKELLAVPFLEFVHPEDRMRMATELQRAQEGIFMMALESRVRARDGSHKWLLWKAAGMPGRSKLYMLGREITPGRGSAPSTAAAQASKPRPPPRGVDPDGNPFAKEDEFARHRGDAGIGRQVLHIEDSATDARLVRAALAGLRDPACDVEHAPGLDAGLERLAAGGIDLVLLDLHLPESQGMATLRRLRDLAPGVPVVVVTGLDDPAAMDLALRAGAEDLVAKGGSDFLGVLRRSVRQALERVQVLEAMRAAGATGTDAVHPRLLRT